MSIENNAYKTKLFAMCVIVFVSLAGIVLFVQLYEETSNMGLDQHFKYTTENIDLLEKPLFKETFLSIYDRNFLRHSGFVLINDFRNVYRIGHDTNIGYTTINRALSSKIEVSGFLKSVYHNYIIPLRLEAEYSKEELLLFFVHDIETMSEYSYLDIIRSNGNRGNIDVYNWALIHSIHISYLKSENDISEIKQLFFEVLDDMHKSGLIADNEIENILEKYRSNFTHDVNRYLPDTVSMHSAESNMHDRMTNSHTWQTGMGGAVKWADLVAHYAEKHNVEFPFFMAIIQSESNGDPYAVSHADAYGLGQVLLPTAKFVTGNRHLKVQELFDPNINLDISARYIRLNIERVENHFTDLSDQEIRTLVAASYNAGWSRVSSLRRVPNFEETKNYVKRVDRYYKLYSENETLILEYITTN